MKSDWKIDSTICTVEYIVERIGHNRRDESIRSFFADTFSDLAEAETTLAANKSFPAPQRRDFWRSTRSLYVRSLEIWQDLETRKILVQADRGKDRIVLRKIALCDSALH